MSPVLKALWYCDSNAPGMDKIYFLVNQADKALRRSLEYFDDTTLVGCFTGTTVFSCEKEGVEVFGEE